MLSKDVFFNLGADTVLTIKGYNHTTVASCISFVKVDQILYKRVLIFIIQNRYNIKVYFIKNPMSLFCYHKYMFFIFFIKFIIVRLYSAICGYRKSQASFSMVYYLFIGSLIYQCHVHAKHTSRPS